MLFLRHSVGLVIVADAVLALGVVVMIGVIVIQSINQSVKNNHLKNDHGCTTNLRAEMKPKENVQNVKTSQEIKRSLKQ